jgi:hypothetical protein
MSRKREKRGRKHLHRHIPPNIFFSRKRDGSRREKKSGGEGRKGEEQGIGERNRGRRES